MTDLRQVQEGDDIEVTLKFKASLTTTYVGHSSGVDGIYLGKNLDPSLYTLKIVEKPLAVGDKVQNKFGDPLGEIRMIEGDEVWVKHSADGSHSTYNIRNVKKDNCHCD